MYARALKAVWFLSLVVFMGVFIYVYAYLPQTVLLNSAGFTLTVSKNTLFYASLPVLSLVNSLVFLTKTPSEEHQNAFKIWSRSQVIALNFFFIVVLVLVALVNSGGEFDYQWIGIFLYGSMAGLVLCALGGLIYLVAKKVKR